MSNYPDDEGRDYVAEQADLEASEANLLEVGVTLTRCSCGKLVKPDMPSVCGCGKRFAYWRTIDGAVKRLDQMDLGHLNNCVRMLAAKAEKYPAELRKPYEDALDIFYAEIGSRDKEITQATGILAALNRSLANE